MNSAPDRNRPLDGIRVLDFTAVVSGPYCTRLLADMGATVIKVEADVGDLLRHAVPLSAAGSRYFAAFNAGKQSIVIDLKAPRACRRSKPTRAFKLSRRCERTTASSCR